MFLIDHVDRANDQAANSLLKTLEEPPDHLILIMTAENAYDLLPTIRSRAVPFYFAPLEPEEMRAFVRARGLGSTRAADCAGGRQSGDRHVARPGGVRQTPRGHAGAAQGSGGRGAVRHVGSDWRGHRPQQERKARAVPEGAVRIAARYPAAARRHGRDSQSGHPPRTGSAGGQGAVRVDSQGGHARGRNRRADPAEYSEDDRAGRADTGIARAA